MILNSKESKRFEEIIATHIKSSIDFSKQIETAKKILQKANDL